jgi:hypothetical protein
MKAAVAWILAMTTGPVFAAISRAQIQDWINTCDLSLDSKENCESFSCVRALTHLVKPETRHAYENLGMGPKSDLNDFGRLHDYCNLHVRQVTTKKHTMIRAHDWTTYLMALKVYREIHANMLVPQSFAVPTDDRRWPEEMRGLKLGNLAHNLRQRKEGLSQNQLDALEELGFEWGISVDENWRKTLTALKAYKVIHGHVRVPRCYIVPQDDIRWPEQTRGIKLGKLAHNLRQRKEGLSQNQLHALDELGFVWGESRDEKRNKNLLALKTYKEIHTNLRVPHRFVVPIDDHRWPTNLHGMKLGIVVLNLRQRKRSLSQSYLDALEALGFDWGVSIDEHWIKNLLAVATYEAIYGHMRVPESFVVPVDDELWPEETHGIKLGHVVQHFRLRKGSLSQNQIDALAFFGFDWTVVD